VAEGEIMVRWWGRLALLLVVAGSAYALGHSTSGVRRQPEAATIQSTQTVPGTHFPVFLVQFRERSHPHGLESDEASRWPPRWVSLWKGGGRHPVWRGCQHVYDPALNAFINGVAPAAAGSGP
jgi:hypothetical protein